MTIKERVIKVLKKITDFMINKRYFILVVFGVLSIMSIYFSKQVKVNYDMAEYLPSTSETRIGMNIMNDKIDAPESSSLNVMLENLSRAEKQAIKTYLENVEGVSSVDYDETEEFNKDNYTLYIVNIEADEESEIATNVYNEITEHFKDRELHTSGAISDRNIPVLPTWIVVLAIFCALLILIVMSDSYVEPFLFLGAILVGVLLNKGTNIMFESVSNITDSIVAILQLALSMDYSIMLMNRYNQEKEKKPDKLTAMKEALYHAFGSIASSSVTTIVGLLALVFMSFTIGRDLGFVLAKGVLFSLISIFFVLPALILIFDDAINKTKKQSPNINLEKLGKFSYHIRPISIFVFVGIFVLSFLLKGNLGILYTDSEDNEVSSVFPENNQMAVIYKNEDEEKVASLLENLESQHHVDDVLGYGNTINQPLTYDNLAQKLNDLGADVNIEDYLLKILYYNYYNKEENNTMTFNEFINFIQTEVYGNQKMGEELDAESRKNIDRLAQFTTQNSMQQLRSVSEIATILEMEPKDVEDVLIYYNSKHNNLKLTVAEFIDFINKDVLTDPEYAGKISQSNRDQLNTLLKFTNQTTNNTKKSSTEMAALFGMDAGSMEQLYKYYVSLNDIVTRMSIAEFSNFVLNDMLNDPQYANNFDEATIQNIRILNTFSNHETIDRQMNSAELASVFGMDENLIKQLLLLKYSTIGTGNTLSVTEFINHVMTLKDTTHYLDGVDLSDLEQISILAQNPNNMNTTKMNKAALTNIFNGVRTNFVENIYLLTGLKDDYTMTPQEFINFVLTTLGTANEASVDASAFSVDKETLDKLKLLKLIIDDSIQTNKTKYSAQQISQILGIPEAQTRQIYALIAFSQNETTTWTASPNELVNLILTNSSNPSVAANLQESTIAQLQLLNSIMTSTLSGANYNYSELAAFIGIDEAKVKSIYTLYQVNHTTLQLTPNEFVDFVLAHRNDSALSGSLSADKISDLQTVQSVMGGVKVGKKYSSSEMSNLLGINKADLDLLYGLHVSKHKSNQTISLQELVDFLLKEVVPSPDYGDRFDAEKTTKLNTIQGIMNATINNTKYTKDEIFTILAVLTDSLDKNMVDLLYVYYGSNREYDNNWTLTVQDFVNFLNESILNDSRFDDFLDEEMRTSITDAKTTIQDAKKLLVGDGYSRVVLNTKFAPESEETFAFIQKVKDLFAEHLDEVYIIGNSPMAYEMSQTFSSELDFITVLTMIAIFVVVAFTFKSIIIPIILVLTIQCAVYLTMGILSLSGGTVYFISLLIVQSILMGATIDYAILYTSYYLEHRKTMDIKQSIIQSYNQSIHTILTSASILVIVTLIVGHFASAIAAKICKTISQGTLCSTILILLLLPAVIAAWDKVIIKNKKA